MICENCNKNIGTCEQTTKNTMSVNYEDNVYVCKKCGAIYCKECGEKMQECNNCGGKLKEIIKDK